MNQRPRRRMGLFRRRREIVLDWLLAQGVFALLWLIGRLGPDRASNLGGRLARTFGPLTPVHRLARDNIAHAFADRSEAERAAILAGAWDNLGRTVFEYPHLGSLYDYEIEYMHPRRCEVVGIRHFQRLLWDGRPAIVFTAHLGNWELSALPGAYHGLPSTVLYRAPNNRFVADYIRRVREPLMGHLLQTSPSAVIAMAGALERGDHFGLLVDQRYMAGIELPFLGRPAMVNTVAARLARRFDCPVHGVRTIRLPGNRFRLELTDALDLPRDADGRIDVAGATAAINAVVEGWVREHPEQWLWMHNRWRR